MWLFCYCFHRKFDWRPPPKWTQSAIWEVAAKSLIIYVWGLYRRRTRLRTPPLWSVDKTPVVYTAGVPVPLTSTHECPSLSCSPFSTSCTGWHTWTFTATKPHTKISFISNLLAVYITSRCNAHKHRRWWRGYDLLCHKTQLNPLSLHDTFKHHFTSL